MTVLFWLLVGHFMADFPLQTEWMARYKNWRNPSPAPPGQAVQPVWPWIMSSHAAVHAGAVAAATGRVSLGIVEFLFHWAIDSAKCAGLFGPTEDQCLHLLCKVAYAAILIGGL